MDQNRERWKSNFAFTMAVAGGAIGLGNIWRFPYLVGENGGGAFVIIFLLAVFILGIPLLITEMSLGRNAQKNSIDAYAIGNSNKSWKIVGWIGAIGAFMIMAYYTVIAGWVLGYSFLALIGHFPLDSANNATFYANYFTNKVTNFWYVLACTSVVIISSYYFLSKGMRGIGKVATILVPALFIIVIIMMVRSLTFEGAMEGVKFYLTPDFSALKPKSMLIAVGQVFYSFSIGYGVSITLASYLNKNTNIPKAAFIAGMSDTSIAILAGFVIFPAVFAFGINPATGTTLVFEILPIVFSQMPLGSVFAFLFFTLLLMAAFTSCLPNYEVMVTIAKEKLNISRKVATMLVLGFVFILGNIPSMLSFSTFQDISIMGKNIFNFFDDFSGNYLFPINGLLLSIFAGWVIHDRIVKEVTNNNTLKFKMLHIWSWILKYVAPILIGIVFLSALLG